MNKNIFICFSSKDYEKVKLIKDKLSNFSFNPIVLFHDTLDEIDNIETVIKNNIDDSSFYLFCDSTNAKASKWVQAELNYIKSKNRHCETISVEVSDEDIELCTENIGRSMLASLKEESANKEIEDKEVWVFLSHSNKDYEKVRRIRNLLEDQSFRPLMFFLCCLEDDQEIDDLIKREIDHRTRFIYCESENAKESKWVQEEVKYIKSQDREFETINLDLPEEVIKEKLMQFKKRASLYISYSINDEHLAKAIWKRLSKYDLFLPPLDNMISNGVDYLKQIEFRIKGASERGFVLCLINDKYVNSKYALHEYNLALKYNRQFGKNNIIPALLSKELVKKIESDMTSEYVKFIPAYGDNIVDIIVEEVLSRMMAPGSILAYAKNFKEGINCNIDSEEAEKLFKLYYKLAKEALDRTPTANIGMALCYENGYGVDVDYDKALEYVYDAIYEGLTGFGATLERIKKKKEKKDAKRQTLEES